MQEVHFNLLAIVAASAARLLIGFLWHEVNPYAKSMLPAIGMTQKEMEKQRSKGIPFEFLAGMVMAWILAHAIIYAGAQGVVQGMVCAFFNWVGFVAVVLLGDVVWTKRPIKVFYFTGGYYLVSMLVMGAILVTWY